MSDPSWKKSNQTKTFTNVKIDELNYESGKWKNVNSEQTNSLLVKKTIKKVVQKLDNQNVVVGISTDQPFSKLSLGDNSGQTASLIGTDDSTLFSGETNTIALQEKADGKNLHGFTYLEGLVGKEVTSATNTGIGISVNSSTASPDPKNCTVYIDSQDCVTIGTTPRNDPVTTKSNEILPKIKLDVNASARIDGFISFIPNFNDSTTDQTGDGQNLAYKEWKTSDIDPNTPFNLPPGAFFIANDNGKPKMYIVDSDGNPSDVIANISLDDIGSSGTTDGLTNLTWSNGKIISLNMKDYTFTLPPSTEINASQWTKVTQGTNIGILQTGTSGVTSTIVVRSIASTWNDTEVLTIHTNPNPFNTTPTGIDITSEPTQELYTILRYQSGTSGPTSKDSITPGGCRVIMDYSGKSKTYIDTNLDFDTFEENKLPQNLLTAIGGNVVILSNNKEIKHESIDGVRQETELSAHLEGNNVFSEGENLKIQNTDNDYGVTDTTKTDGTEVSFTPDVNSKEGGNLWIERQLTIGPTNNDRLRAMIDIEGEYKGIPAINIGSTTTNSATDSIIIGTQENGNNIGGLIDNRNTLIMGKNTNININNSIVGGSKNTVYGMTDSSNRHNTTTTGDDSTYHHNSVVIGNNNNVRGTQNYVFGQNNKIGVTDTGNQDTNNRLVFNTFIAGQNNIIKKDVTSNDDSPATTLKPSDNESFVLMGSNATIDLDADPDLRFAFGTEANGGSNVFTIDTNGNVVVGNDLNVNGEVSIGSVTLGKSATDIITVGGTFTNHMIPTSDSTYDIGSSSNKFKDLHLSNSISVKNLKLDGNTISSTEDIYITPIGSNKVNISKVNIDSGYIDGTAIGDNAPSSGKFTNLEATGNVILGDGSTSPMDMVTINSSIFLNGPVWGSSTGYTQLKPNDIVSSRIITFPSTTTTLVGNNTVDDLTNKTFKGPDQSGNEITYFSPPIYIIPVAFFEMSLQGPYQDSIWEIEINSTAINYEHLGNNNLLKAFQGMALAINLKQIKGITAEVLENKPNPADDSTVVIADLYIKISGNADGSQFTIKPTKFSINSIINTTLNGFNGFTSTTQYTTANGNTTAVYTNASINGTTIATSNITVGGGKILDVSAGTLTLADDQISGDKVDGGTIASIAISQLAGAMDCNSKTMSNVDINSGNIGGATIATSNITVGGGKTLDVSAGTLTTSSTQKKAILEGANADIDIGNFKLSHGGPTQNGHSATKEYVDNEISNITGGSGGTTTSVSQAKNLESSTAQNNQIPYQSASNATSFNSGLTFNGSDTLTCTNFAGNASSASTASTAKSGSTLANDISGKQNILTDGAFVNGDKTKLDNIADNANKYILPPATTGAVGGIRVGTNLSIDAAGVLSAPTITASTTTISVSAPTGTPAVGSFHFNTASSKLHIYTGGSGWSQIN